MSQDQGRYVLRDDDVSFVTGPDQLEKAWGWYLAREGAKLNLAVIPFVRPCEFGQAEDREQGLADNKELTAYLKKLVGEKKVEILMHGFNHASDAGSFEFAGRNRQMLSRRLQKGKEYLQDLFGTSVRCFVPPHNALSREGLTAVRDAGMDILAAVPFSPYRVGVSAERLGFYLRRLAFSWRYRRQLKGKYVYPFLTAFSSHRQLDCVPFIPGLYTAEDLCGIYDIIARSNGRMCLATHYWELEPPARSEIEAYILFLEHRRNARAGFCSEVLGGG